MSDLKTLKSILIDTFKVKNWSRLQYDTYKTIQQYVNDFREVNRISEIKDDLTIIRCNLKDQVWFNLSKSKPIIGHLLDTMQIIHYTYDENIQSTNFNISISFNKFQVHCSMYKNLINNFTNYYIFFENEKHLRAYMSFYTTFNTNETELSKCKLPEFDKIYEITNLSQNILYQSDLINFFSEIIMYYDESGKIGDLPIGNDLNVTLNQLIEKSNRYLSQKKTDVNYNFNN